MVECPLFISREPEKEERVPKRELEGAGEFDVEEGQRLVLAIEEDAGVGILHRIGSEIQKTEGRVFVLCYHRAQSGLALNG